MKFILIVSGILILGSTGCSFKNDSAPNSQGYILIDGGTKFFYRLKGSGDTLVVLHGGPGLSHQYLYPQLDSLLSVDFTLIFYDQRASGWSGGELDTSQLTMQRFVEDLEQLRQRFNIDKINLLGHSFGGLLAMYYGIRYPEHTGKLILVDSDAASWEKRTPYQRQMIRSRLKETDWDLMDSIKQLESYKDKNPKVHERYFKIFLTSYFYERTDTQSLTLGFDSIMISKIDPTSTSVRNSLGKYDIHSKLNKITSPVLILQGRESVFSVEGANSIHKKISNSELIIFEECGHFPYIEKPKEFKKSINNFMNKKQ